MLKKTQKYNFKKLLPIAMIGLLPAAFNACEEPEDPVVTAARKELNIAANEFRRSIEPARQTIEPFFDSEKSWAEYNFGTPTNLKDSCDVYGDIANRLWNVHGKPLPRNHDNVQKMSDTANECLIKIAAYNEVKGK